MKKFILFSFCLALFAVAPASLYAADNDDKRYNLLEDELEYIEEQNILSSTQFEKFEKLYKQYNLQRNALKTENRQLNKESHNPDLPEEDVLKLINKVDNNKMSIAVLEQTYHYKYLEIMSAKQYVAIKKARHDFKMMSFKKMKKD